MKDYKAEIEKILVRSGEFHMAWISEHKQAIVNNLVSLFREIAKEAVGEDRQVVYYGDFVGHAKEAMQSLVNKGYNERGSEILSNVEKVIGGK